MIVSQQQQQVSEDYYFDRLPDELLLSIFSRVHDAASLVRLLSLCRRFRSLVPLVRSVSLSFASPKLPRQGKGVRQPSSFARNPLGFLYDRVFRGLARRLLVCSRSGSRGCRSCLEDEDIVEEVGGRLRCFGEARDVRVSLPCEGGAADKDGTFLKWRASYGSSIRSCVILGAGEVCGIGESLPGKAAAADGEEGTGALLSDGELKLRVVWVISCLIAASYRHYMAKKVIASNPMLRKIVVGDERGQGEVVMGEGEVGEVRKEGGGDIDSKDEHEEETERSEVPDLRMKLWHAPYLELPRCGMALKGATLVVMTPVVVAADGRDEEEILQGGIGMDQEEEEDDDDQDGVFVEAMRELRKRNKLYLLEMNSF